MRAATLVSTPREAPLGWHLAHHPPDHRQDSVARRRTGYLIISPREEIDELIPESTRD